MDNVNELNHTTSINRPQTQQTISLSTLSAEESAKTINIDATNGLHGVTSNYQNSRPIVKINPNKRPEHRTITDPDDIQTVDPSEIIPPQPKPRSVTPRDVAISDLDAAVNRKRKEYSDFIAKANKEDKINRENIEAGLETVNDEMQYMPNGLHEEIKESDKVIPAEDYEDSDESYDNDWSNSMPPDAESVTITNPFDDTDDHEEDNTDSSFDDDDVADIVADPEEEESYGYYNDTTKETFETRVDGDIEERFNENNEIKVTSSVITDEVEASNSDFDIDESDFEDVSTKTDENLTDDQLLEISEASERHLRSEIMQKIVQAGKTLNTSQLSVSNKVININDVLKNSARPVDRTSTWPLTFAGRPYIASALKGPEIALMSDSDTSGNDGVGLSMTQARIMFEHDANPYRPNTLEAWAKTIPFADVENIFAALYTASIKGANYIPMACEKQSCQYSYLSDNTDINTMIKFETDDAKKRFEEIKKMQLTAENTGSYESVVSVINDNFAVGLKLPSIFTILYEYGSLNSEFVNKYTAMVSIIQYIDYIYYIDPESKSLNPIGWKPYPGDYTKSFKSKIATYAKILKELDDTDFSILMALINSMISKASDLKNISFEIPGTKCPKCGADIPARPINARGLVFMRQRLVELATTPIAK